MNEKKWNIRIFPQAFSAVAADRYFPETYKYLHRIEYVIVYERVRVCM